MDNSIQEDTIITSSNTNSVKELEQETEAASSIESRVIEWNEFEQAIIEGTEPNFYIVETGEGFDYIKADFDGDGIDDAIALLTFEGDPENYDDDTFTAIIYLLGNEDGELNQIGSSGNLGGESIQYKGAKKLKWNDDTLTYIHQSGDYHLEVLFIINDLSSATPIEKVSICDYSDIECVDLYEIGEDTFNLRDLSKELLLRIRKGLKYGNAGPSAFEKNIMSVIPNGFFLARNDKAYEYVQGDYNHDGYPDVVAIITSQSDYIYYDYNQDVVKMAYFEGNKDEALKLKTMSQNIGAFSLENVSRPKKLSQKGDTVSYEYMAMRYSDFFYFSFVPDRNDFILLEKVHCDPSCKSTYQASPDTVHTLSSFNEDLIFEY